MKKISVYRDFDIKIAQNGKYFASSVELNAFLGLAKAFADISEVKDAIDEFWRKNDYISNKKCPRCGIIEFLIKTWYHS